jgi:hypothetical protein
MIKHSLNIIFFLTIISVYSQTNISGVIVDQQNSESIPFAIVGLKYGDTILEEQADFDGVFHFNDIDSERLNLSVKCLGYFNFDSTLHVSSDTVKLTIELINDPTIKYEVVLSEYNKKGALNNISKGEIQLLLPGGIAGAPYLHSDTIFEKKYNVTFILLGCVRYPGGNQLEYNTEMFKYLDEQYGEVWRKEIRKDVIGLKMK